MRALTTAQEQTQARLAQVEAKNEALIRERARNLSGLLKEVPKLVKAMTEQTESMKERSTPQLVDVKGIGKPHAF